MIEYGKVKSILRPQPLEITDTAVFVASNIRSYARAQDGIMMKGYIYDYTKYDKNEYIQLMAEKNDELETNILDTQSALCDVYELLGGES